jgi:hypothetical protein
LLGGSTEGAGLWPVNVLQDKSLSGRNAGESGKEAGLCPVNDVLQGELVGSYRPGEFDMAGLCPANAFHGDPVNSGDVGE